MNSQNLLLGLTTLSLLLGCPAEPDLDEMADGAAATPGTTGDVEETGATTQGDEADDGEPADEGGSESSGGTTFIVPPDAGMPGVFACDVWAQDCPDGSKCIGYASDGGTWNGTRCAEIADNANQPGDTCTVEGGGASGIDDCDIGSMCWDINPETNEGVCVALCNGSADNPICDDPDTTCSIANNGALTLCLPQCDPLLQDCEADTQACYPINDAWACAPDASGEDGAFGSACEFLNVCDPGLACLQDAVADCATGSCCTTVCDITQPNDCAGVGQSCESWYAEGEAPPQYEDLGVCVIAS